MLTEHLLDARLLEAPEPFIQATTLLRAMVPGQYLRMLLRRVPYPLFDFCNALSLQYQILKHTSDECEVLIYHPDDVALLREKLQDKLTQ